MKHTSSYKSIYFLDFGVPNADDIRRQIEVVTDDHEYIHFGIKPNPRRMTALLRAIRSPHFTSAFLVGLSERMSQEFGELITTGCHHITINALRSLHTGYRCNCWEDAIGLAHRVATMGSP